MTLRTQTKLEIQSAIDAHAEPRVPRSGIGLVLSHNGTRKTLVNAAGVTKVGRYYYDRMNEAPPSRFDFAQEPQRAGRSLTIRLLDGTRKAVSRFNPDTTGPEPNRFEGKVLILASVHDTFPTPTRSTTLWISVDDFATTQKLKREVCLGGGAADLPVSCEYMDKELLRTRLRPWTRRAVFSAG